jgi:cysteine-rich repeat protein
MRQGAGLARTAPLWLVAVMGCSSGAASPEGVASDADPKADGGDATTGDAPFGVDGPAYDASPIFEVDTNCGNSALDPGETCDDGNAKDGDGCSSSCQIEGCGTGDRTALKDWKTFPDIAVCGAMTDYPTSLADAPKACGPGFHMCTLLTLDLEKGLTGKTKPAEIFRAWIKYDEPTCTAHSVFNTNVTCKGTAASSAFFSKTGGCTPSRACAEGWRPVLADVTWDWSLRNGTLGATCSPHLSFACGFPGGGVKVQTAAIACCRG